MKNFLLLVLFIPFVSFSQDIDLNKVPTKTSTIKIKKEKKSIVSSPLEININYGLFYNFSDSITRTYTFTKNDTSKITKLPSSVLDSTMIKNSYSLGFRKQYGKFLIGVDFSHVTSSDNIDDYLKNFIFPISNSNLSQSYVYESSTASNKMNSNRLKLNIDYIFYDKNKSLIHFGLGVGYSKTILKNYSSNQYVMTLFDNISQEVIEVTYFARNQSINYLNESMFVSPSFSYEYKLSSHLKVNTNISLFIPLNDKLTRTGFTNSYNEIGVPFNGVYELQTEVVDVIETTSYKQEWVYRFKNPMQIGLNVGLVYTLGKKNK
jgi:hypothetical protein